MTEEETLNTDDSSPPEETLNETNDPSSLKESADLVSTTEYEVPEPPEEESKTEDGDDQEADEPEDDEKDKNVSEHVPYDRFQEVVSKNNELAEKLAKIEGKLEAKSEAPKDDLPYRNIATMSNDEITDEIQDNPLNFMANLASQVQHETLFAVEKFLNEKETKVQQENVQKSVQTTIKEYADSNPDFKDMSNEIQTYINNNPGHTQISAHMALTQEKRIADAVSKAIKETEKRKDNEHKTKRSARVLPSGAPKIGNSTQSVELVDTKKHGGLTNVLSRRLAALRRGS